MRKPGRVVTNSSLVILIPARNEAENLNGLLPVLTPQATVYVFDDESEDDTAQVARSLGAKVVIPSAPLPEGWTGKNHACHELAKAALEDSDADWLVFLDADVKPSATFVQGMLSLVRPGVGVITGFPKVLPGKGIEPLFLAWVGWILLATNPFGLVSRTGMGHNRFTNGQVHMWRSDVYADLWPNEQVRDRVLEDVAMGRLLAKRKIGVETANLSSILAVRMYNTWRETLDGMSKNSFEITGSVWGTALLGLFLVVCGWLWLVVPWTLGLLLLSGVAVVRIARAPLWPVLLMPLVPTIAGVTLFRSLAWKRRGQIVWKGRTYR